MRRLKKDPHKALQNIRRVGNSLGIILPRLLIDGFGEDGTFVQVVRIGRYIVLTPLRTTIPFDDKQISDALDKLLEVS